MSTVRFAVVGLGFISRAHIAALRALPAVRSAGVRPVLSALVTRRPAEVLEEAREMGFALVTDSLEEALAGGEVDAVDIATPNALHKQALMTALAYGKAIYCEKPLASNATDAEAMAAAVAEAGVTEQVALVYRYNPAVGRMKAHLEAGSIGRLLQFKATFNHSGYLNAATVKGWKSQSALAGGGALLDLGVHIIDMLQLLVGRLNLRHGEAKTMIPSRSVAPGQAAVDVDVDDWALLHVTNPDGVPGVVETSRIALGAECCRIELYGTNGSIVCDLHHELEPRVQTFTAVPSVAAPAMLQYLPPARLSLGSFIDAHQASLYHFLLRYTGADPTPGWAPRFTDSLQAERLVYEALRR